LSQRIEGRKEGRKNTDLKAREKKEDMERERDKQRRREVEKLINPLWTKCIFLFMGAGRTAQ
jgi:hypothetical protein